ncbi:carboxypeptidase regulatory-like domain-containing protein [Curtobacterium sp. A7_M15]|uniref:MSCRAMM family protein n=1 Tax=Curtobacterium sp. A7_M15 TaxID=3065241 RepID=UPI002737FD8C|nr:carboxypeptidase regulatory-like domain-containing protein [Curtobacterium sp. A7_M15]MDP4333934.1 carboxypeptidase regulatory-like domain-containing protein [Curtobacterium sp. A7_M15]
MRTVTAALTALALGGGLALVGASSASAEPAGHWGTFTLAGQSRAYTGTMTLPGFPETTFESNSRQSTVISGASTWQGTGTGPGAAYGSSRGNTYLNQRPLADATGQPSVTTYTFAEPTPGASSWSFVLGDIDADRATISAVTQSGAAATAADIGFSGAYNSCSANSPGGWSCPADPDGTVGRDVPTWDPATLTLTGNAGSVDTAGATAWFTPTTPLTSLTITYERRSGFPVYQTWFADRTAAISGTATLDGTPIPGATVTVTAPRGTVYTTTTAADGTYSFPGLPVINDYRVSITAPPGATGAATVTGVSLNGVPGGVDQVADFPFVSPTGTTAVVGQVVDDEGNPAADVPVVISDPNATAPIETVTNDEGYYTASGLTPNTPVTVAVDGADPVTITTGDAAPAAPTAIDRIETAAVASVGGVVRLDGAPQAGVTVVLLDAAGTIVATTVTGTDGSYSFTTVGGTYTVRSALPAPDATGTATSTAVTLVAGGADQTRDFAFATPAAPEAVTTSANGRVVDTDDAPVAGRTVTATPDEADSGAPVTATTGTDGGYTLEGLDPTTEYTVSVTGSDATVAFTSGLDATDVVTVDDLVVAAAASPSPTPTATPTPTASPSPTTAPVAATGSGSTSGALAYTGADLTPGLIAAGVLVLLGAGLLTFRAVRNRRRTSHLQD